MPTLEADNCFVVCPIGSKGSDIKIRSDDIFSSLIEPITEENGYKAFRIIDDTRPGEITSQIVDAIYNSPLVIADLSGKNPNFFYELALRHSTGLPFIHMSDDTSSIPFDISPLNVIEIRTGSFSGMEETISELRAQLASIRNGTASFENPVSRYRKKVRLEESGDPTEKQLFDIQSQISRLTRDVERLKPTLDYDDDFSTYGSYARPIKTRKSKWADALAATKPTPSRLSDMFEQSDAEPPQGDED